MFLYFLCKLHGRRISQNVEGLSSSKKHCINGRESQLHQLCALACLFMSFLSFPSVFVRINSNAEPFIETCPG